MFVANCDYETTNGVIQVADTGIQPLRNLIKNTALT